MSRNIIVYENDLKFAQEKKINFESKNIVYDKDTKQKINKNYDCLDARLEESCINNSSFLDLSQLNLTNLYCLLKFNNLIPKVYKSITYLFLNNNNLSSTLDLRCFTNLISVDLGHNLIDKVLLPNTLQELVINDNNITELPTNIDLIRLTCDDNKIKYIPDYKNLEILQCSKNKINNIKSYYKLHKLIIHDNPLVDIDICPNLIYLDISVTPINNINTFQNLDHLVANNTKLTVIPYMEKLTTLEVIHTPIKRIGYFPNIDTILCSVNLTKHISSKYNDKYNIKLKNGYVICISLR